MCWECFFFFSYAHVSVSLSEGLTHLCPVGEKPLTGAVFFLAVLLGHWLGGRTEGVRKLQEAAISHALLAKNLTFLNTSSTGPGTLGEKEEKATQHRKVV